MTEYLSAVYIYELPSVSYAFLSSGSYHVAPGAIETRHCLLSGWLLRSLTCCLLPRQTAPTENQRYPLALPTPRPASMLPNSSGVRWLSASRSQFSEARGFITAHPSSP